MLFCFRTAKFNHLQNLKCKGDVTLCNFWWNKVKFNFEIRIASYFTKISKLNFTEIATKIASVNRVFRISNCNENCKKKLSMFNFFCNISEILSLPGIRCYGYVQLLEISLSAQMQISTSRVVFNFRKWNEVKFELSSVVFFWKDWLFCSLLCLFTCDCRLLTFSKLFGRNEIWTLSKLHCICFF